MIGPKLWIAPPLSPNTPADLFTSASFKLNMGFCVVRYYNFKLRPFIPLIQFLMRFRHVWLKSHSDHLFKYFSKCSQWPFLAPTQNKTVF